MALESLSGIYEWVVSWLSSALGPMWTKPPHSTLLVFLLAVLLSISSSAITRALVDVEKWAKQMKEVSEWQREYMRALKSGDQKLIAKAKKKEPSIRRLRSEMSKQQLKPLAATFIPFLTIWWIFNGVFKGSIVAVSPIPLPFVGYNLDFIAWYILSSFSLTSLVQRVFGIPTVSD